MQKDSGMPPIKILLSKIGLDGHNRGILLVARILRDSGFEVVYLGWHRAPEEIAESAVQEDVDVIGVSFLSGHHLYYAPRIEKLIKKNKLDDVLFIIGGNIPEDDINKLKKTGVGEIFRSGEPTSRIVEYIRNNVKTN